MVKFMSVEDCDNTFYECLDVNDFENASAYYETLKHHYKQRGKRVKKLNKIIQVMKNDNNENRKIN